MSRGCWNNFDVFIYIWSSLVYGVLCLSWTFVNDVYLEVNFIVFITSMYRVYILKLFSQRTAKGKDFVINVIIYQDIFTLSSVFVVLIFICQLLTREMFLLSLASAWNTRHQGTVQFETDRCKAEIVCLVYKVCWKQKAIVTWDSKGDLGLNFFLICFELLNCNLTVE